MQHSNKRSKEQVMRTIYKATLDFDKEEHAVTMPGSAVSRHFAMQNGKPCVWYELDTSLVSTVRHYRIYGTGWPFNSDPRWSYVGTTQDGPFIWHLYELLR
jgi:hypothetical protein